MFAILLMIALGDPAPSALAQPSVTIGINLPAPPSMVIVPDTPVMYAPGVAANYFFYDGRYYLFTQGGWHVARTHRGPWAVVAPAYVPLPLLRVPVRYYQTPPPQWKHARRDAPPGWNAEWGHEWKKAHKDDDRDGKKAQKEDEKEHKHFEKEARKERRK